ncbi:unnamed protein product [Amoebophrya sp. A25]|nr:unnamed protein product [Amoebophrya sp. A25]|eukprot:GSA25T00012160001.1
MNYSETSYGAAAAVRPGANAQNLGRPQENIMMPSLPSTVGTTKDDLGNNNVGRKQAFAEEQPLAAVRAGTESKDTSLAGARFDGSTSGSQEPVTPHSFPTDYLILTMEFCRAHVLHFYLSIVFGILIACAVIGIQPLLAALLDFANDHYGSTSSTAEIWQKRLFVFVGVATSLFLGLPVVPLLMFTGFFLKKVVVATLLNACALAVVSFGQYKLARGQKKTLRVMLQRDFPRSFRVATLVERDPKLVVLFRFCFFPLILKNLVAGVLRFPPLAFALSVAAHSLYLGALFAWVGSASRDLTQALVGEQGAAAASGAASPPPPPGDTGGNKSTTSNWSGQLSVQFVAWLFLTGIPTVVMIIVLSCFYSKEFGQMRQMILAESESSVGVIEEVTKLSSGRQGPHQEATSISLTGDMPRTQHNHE